MSTFKLHVPCSGILSSGEEVLIILPELSRVSSRSVGGSADLTSVFTLSSATFCSKDDFIPQGVPWTPLWNRQKETEHKSWVFYLDGNTLSEPWSKHPAEHAHKRHVFVFWSPFIPVLQALPYTYIYVQWLRNLLSFVNFSSMKARKAEKLVFVHSFILYHILYKSYFLNKGSFEIIILSNSNFSLIIMVYAKCDVDFDIHIIMT